MKRFVEGKDRTQGVLLPEFLDDYVAEDDPVRAIDVFVDELDLRGLGFEGVAPKETGRPTYHPATMLKIYVYGYINQVQSSSRRSQVEIALPGRTTVIERHPAYFDYLVKLLKSTNATTVIRPEPDMPDDQSPPTR